MNSMSLRIAVSVAVHDFGIFEAMLRGQRAKQRLEMIDAHFLDRNVRAENLLGTAHSNDFPYAHTIAWFVGTPTRCHRVALLGGVL